MVELVEPISTKEIKLANIDVGRDNNLLSLKRRFKT
jgi:hypothetical protein